MAETWTRWTDGEVSWLKRNAGDPVTTAVLADRLNEIFGNSRTPESTQIRLNRLGIHRRRQRQLVKKAQHKVPQVYHMKHIRMAASGYRRVCCMCGKRIYVAETVISKDGVQRTYCKECFKKRRRR